MYSNRLESLALVFGRDAYFLEAARKCGNVYCSVDETGDLYFDKFNLTKANDGKVEMLVDYLKKRISENEFEEDEEELPNIEDNYNL